MSEFFKFLGYIFFTACFEGICGGKDWWTLEQIETFSGTPFDLKISWKLFDTLTNHHQPTPIASMMFARLHSNFLVGKVKFFNISEFLDTNTNVKLVETCLEILKRVFMRRNYILPSILFLFSCNALLLSQIIQKYNKNKNSIFL